MVMSDAKQSFRCSWNKETTAMQRASHLVCAAAIFLLLAVPSHAQQINSSISGTVTDENKSLVPNAAVVVESAQLAVRRNATTNDQGYFIVTNLPVGTYRVTVAAPGFSNFTQESIKVDVGVTLSLNI